MAKTKITDEEALAFHLEPTPGKFEVRATVPMTTQRDLSLAYSPGVAVPCEAIAANPETAYDYTNKGNLVAVISNGTAVLGLGNLGALGSKPVMEGKAVLFKRFADVNAVDIELDTEDPDEIIQAVKWIQPSFGGINLEDFAKPKCFRILERLREEMDIPVWHDDQQGTASITLAGLINGLKVVGKDMNHVEKNIDKIEESIVQIGRFTVGREHFMELARGVAGAFLGVGVGLGIRWMPGVAENLAWANAIGILVFIFALGAILIYKNEKEWISKQGNSFIPKRLMHLFMISIGVEIVALYLFNLMPTDPSIAIKTLIVGSYPAMSGAITFTIT